MKEFLTWKEREEELTYTTYIKDQSPYHPKGCDGIPSSSLYSMHSLLT